MKRFVILIISFLAVSIAYPQQQSVTTQGTEFWTVFMLNSDLTAGDSGLELSLMVTAKRACSVTVRNPNTTWTNTFNVDANSTYKFVIPTSQHSQCYINTPTVNGVNKGLLVTSTDTISLYASNFVAATFDGSIVLPATALGNEYIIQGYTPTLVGYENQSNSWTEFSVTAVEDNTIVDVTPSVACYTNTSSTTTSPFTITLNRGQSAFITSTCFGANGDLSGTRVAARHCKKIAVYNGNNTTQVPSGNFGDHIYEQAFPITSWGKKFVVTNTLQNASTGRTKDCIRVTASADNTTIRKNGSLLTTINAGQTYEFQITATEKSAYIETSNPSAVYLYLVSQTQGGSSLGDPSMVWIAPLEQRINNIIFNTFQPTISSSYAPSTHIVNIVAETSNTSQIRLDGSAITGWETVTGNTNYSFTRKVITHSSHSITSTGGNGFIAHVYGIGDVVSYAYSVGSMATNLAERMFINGIGSTDADAEGSFCEGQEIVFTSEVDYDYDNINWNFDDGTTISGSSATHTYTEQGEYTVSMQVTSNGSGCSSFSTAVNFNVSIGHVWEKEITTEANYGETITIQGATFVANNDTTITRLYQSVAGCDSTVIHHVIIRNIIYNYNAEICAGDTYNENGFNESEPGTYTIVTHLPSGIDSITNLTLTVHPPIRITTTSINVSCNNGTDGAISVDNVVNGQAPYTYNWNNGQSTEIAIGLAAGNYMVTVTDANNCTATAAATIQQPPALTMGSSIKNANCRDACDGRIAVEVNGGTPSYAYRWNNGYNTAELMDLCAGTYSVTVTDANGCTIGRPYTITQPSEFSATATATDATCHAGMDGKITVSVSGGTLPYTFALNESMSGGTTDNNITNLSAGAHIIYIRDANNCITRTEAVIGSPDRLMADYETVNVSCKEASDGEIHVSALGGNPPYYITTTENNNIPLADNPAITGLRSGIYHLVVSDERGCSYSLSNIRIPDNPNECLHVPNVFTPNGDGINDTWEISNIQMYPDAKIFVFNRWGQKMYEGDGTSEYWNGEFRGKLVPAGTYFYVVNIGEGYNTYSGPLSILY